VPGFPSVTADGSVPSATEEEVAVPCSARSVPGWALSSTATVHRLKPQPVARVPQFTRTYLACRDPRSTVCVYASAEATNGSGTL
jgi:hypothetical protein